MFFMLISLYIVSVSNTIYTLQLHGHNKLSVGMNLTIQCMVLASGSPVESSNIQLCLALPTGEVIIDREFNTIATLEHNGTYSCIAVLNGVPTVATLPVIVYGK